MLVANGIIPGFEPIPCNEKEIQPLHPTPEKNMALRIGGFLYTIKIRRKESEIVRNIFIYSRVEFAFVNYIDALLID